MIVRDLLFRLGVDVNRRSFQQAERGVQNIQNQATQATKKAKGFGSAISGSLLAFGAAGAAMAAGQWLGGTIISMEQLKTSLIAVSGSAEEAEKAFAKLQGFAARTPYQLEEVAGAYRKLKAFGLDPSERALESYGNTASAMGKSLDQLIEAVADAATGEFERLKEFGIKSKKVGSNVQFTFKGVTTTVKNNSEAIQAYLMNIGETDFAGAMERQSKTLGGMLSTLKDGAAQFAMAVGEAGLLDALKELATVFGQTQGGGASLAKIVGFVLATAVKSLTMFLQVIIRVVRGLVDLFKRLIPKDLIKRMKGLNEEFGKGAKAVLLLFAPILGLLLLLEDFIAFLQGRKSVIGNFVNQLKDSPGLFGKIARAIDYLTSKELWGKITDGFKEVKRAGLWVWEQLQPVFRAFGKAWEWIKVAAVKAWKYIKRMAQPVIQLLKDSVSDLGERWEQVKPHIESVKEAVGRAVEIVGKFVERIKEGIALFLETDFAKEFGQNFLLVWDSIVEAVGWGIGLMKDLFQGMISGIIDGVAWMWNAFATFLEKVLWFVDNLPQLMMSAWDAIIGWIEGVINSAIGFINDMIDTANEIPGVDIGRLGKVKLSSGGPETAQQRTIDRNLGGAPGAQTNTVGNVTVNVQGSTNMGPDEIEKATAKGYSDAWARAFGFTSSGVR